LLTRVLDGSRYVLYDVIGITLAGESYPPLAVSTLIAQLHAALEAIIKCRRNGQETILDVFVSHGPNVPVHPECLLQHNQSSYRSPSRTRYIGVKFVAVGGSKPYMFSHACLRFSRIALDA
jgi:hypothetical protein